MEVVGLKSSTLLMVIVALFITMCSINQEAAMAQKDCNSIIAAEVVDITTKCAVPIVTPVAGLIDVDPDCCTAAKNFNFECSCSPVVLDLQNQGLVNLNALIAAANYCGISAPAGLQCLGVAAPTPSPSP